MFQITGDALAGIVVGFVLGVLVHRAYNRLMHEVVEEKPEPEQTAEPKSEPKTFGRSCQKFSSAMNIDWQPDKCQYLIQTAGGCTLFGKQLFILGGKYERCAECKQKYP